MLSLSRVAFRAARRDFCARGSARARVQAAQLAEAAHVVSQVLHPDLCLRPHHADRAHQCAAHVIGLCAEDMLDARAHRRFRAIAALGLFGQRLAALALAMDVAPQLHAAQPGFHLLGPICGISPDTRTGVAPRQQVVHRLASVVAARYARSFRLCWRVIECGLLSGLDVRHFWKPRAGMEICGSGPKSVMRAFGSLPGTGFPHPDLFDHCAHSSCRLLTPTDAGNYDRTIMPPPPAPDLYNLQSSSASPRSVAPSCSPERSRPTFSACVSTSLRATSPPRLIGDRASSASTLRR